MISQLQKWITKGLGVAMVVAVPITPAFAGSNWGISLGGGGLGFSYNDSHRRGHHRGYGGYSGYGGYGGRYYGSGGYSSPYYQQYNYYPSSVPYNPVIRRDVKTGGEYAPDGTFHSNTTVEDSRASYYSPGRNTAITPPETTTTRVYGPDGRWVNRERTSWIGADGRPHSTTIDQETTQDVWGNTHTDTNVTLKEKKEAAEQKTKKQ